MASFILNKGRGLSMAWERTWRVDLKGLRMETCAGWGIKGEGTDLRGSN